MTARRETWLLICGAAFLLVLIHGLSLGPSDDEAYYWVLSQKLDWGYAYHPPLIAWSIAFFDGCLRVLGANPGTGLRFTSAVYTLAILAVAGLWLRTNLNASRTFQALLLFASFPCIFAFSWMTVPDLPLFLGTLMVFAGTWDLCFSQMNARPVEGQMKWPRSIPLLFLGLGTCTVGLSKFSGVLVPFSSLVCFLFLGKQMPASTRWKAISCVVIGGVLALVPTIIFNIERDWGPLLYQLRDRHQGAHVSGVRWAQFWVVQILAAGPILLFYFLRRMSGFVGKDASRDRARWIFALIWAVPPFLVYGFQPIWAHFKPHWGFVIWIPIALVGALEMFRDSSARWAKLQMAYGFVVISFVFLSCHLPIPAFLHALSSGEQSFDPRWDVTNDLYGWSDWVKDLNEKLQSRPRAGEFMVVGSYYQTASQAAFALGDVARVTKFPVQAKERLEWQPLVFPIIYVADNRYEQKPRFSDSQCSESYEVETSRWGFAARTIKYWFCESTRTPQKALTN